MPWETFTLAALASDLLMGTMSAFVRIILEPDVATLN